MLKKIINEQNYSTVCSGFFKRHPSVRFECRFNPTSSLAALENTLCSESRLIAKAWHVVVLVESREEKSTGAA